MAKLNLMCSAWGETLLTDLNTMRKAKEMCDVKLILKGGALALAHSPILAAASPFFRSILEGAENPELNMEDFPKDVIRQVLDFVYTGSVDVDMTEMYMLHTVAVDLNIKLLQDMVEQVMQNFPTKMEVVNEPGDEPEVEVETEVEAHTEEVVIEMENIKQAPQEVGDVSKVEMQLDDMVDEEAITTASIITENHSVISEPESNVIEETIVMEHMEPESQELTWECPETGTKRNVEIEENDGIIVIKPNTPKVVIPKVKKSTKKRRITAAKKSKVSAARIKSAIRGVIVGDSELPSVEKGIFTTTDFPEDLSFGPYERESDFSSGEQPNWLRLINFAPSQAEANVEAYEYKGHTFFRTTKDITTDVELLLWCYADQMVEFGINEPDDRDAEIEALGPSPIYLPTGEVHEPPEERFDCEHCGLSFIDEFVFCRHQRTSHNIPIPIDTYRRMNARKVYTVKKCQNTPIVAGSPMDLTEKQRNLRRGKRGRDKEKLYQCTAEDCQDRFATLTALRQHMGKHSDVRAWVCHICNRGFTQKGNLSTHMMIHSGEKKYKCEKCEKSFTEASNFRRHWRTHTGEKPFLCFTCGQRFSQFCHLEAHTRKHTGDRPFNCPQCPKSFRDQSSMRTHLKRHGEKTYLCQLCNKTYHTNGELNNHKKTNHYIA